MTPTGSKLNNKREYIIYTQLQHGPSRPVLLGASAAPALPSAPLDPEPSPPLAPSPEPCPASRARPTPPLFSAGWAPPPPLPPSSSSCSHCGPWTAGSSAAPANGARPGAAGAAPASITPSGASWQTRTQHIGQSLKPGFIAVYAVHLTLPLEGPRQRPHLLRLQTKQALLPPEQRALLLPTLRQVSALDLPSDRTYRIPPQPWGMAPSCQVQSQATGCHPRTCCQLDTGCHLGFEHDLQHFKELSAERFAVCQVPQQRPYPTGSPVCHVYRDVVQM